jgi:hypothetical protein
MAIDILVQVYTLKGLAMPTLHFCPPYKTGTIFSGEYQRLFGTPLMRDVERRRTAARETAK